MTSSELDSLVLAARSRYGDAVRLVEASMQRYKPYDPLFSYSPLEREPYDALCNRYLRAVEMAVRYFRTVERSRLALNSESYRDLLGNMAKWGVITDVDLWFRMRDLRNRIAHDYLPDQLAEIYSLIVSAYGPELLGVLAHGDRQWGGH
jgi:hypothetical protein